MQKDYSYGIIPIFRNSAGGFEFALIHQKTKSGKGFWGFPKGHAEYKETGIQAASRELAEEIGITEISIKKEPQRSFSYSFWQDGIHYDKTVNYWIGFVKKQSLRIQEEELLEARRYHFSEAKEKISHESMKTVLKEVGKYLGIE